MILRQFTLRHGRNLGASVSRTSLRALSSEQTDSNTTTTDQLPIGQGGKPSWLLERVAKRQSDKQERQQRYLNDPAPDDFRIFKTIQKRTKKIGSSVEVRYKPDEIIQNPPEDASLELLMASQAHMGHHTSLWNPGNSRYIYGVREGIHIISLETTLAHLRRAARVVEQVAYHGGLILFIGSRKGQTPIVTRAAELAGACHMWQKWTPGTITNRDQLLNAAPLRVVDENDQELEGFNEHIRSCRPVMPDLVICLNPLENFPLLYECGQEQIPSIGIIDTDADPSWVTYQIPANDDSLRSVAVIAGVLGRAGERGNKRRLEDARKGIVTWENPTDIKKFVLKQKRINEDEEQRFAALVQSQVEGEKGSVSKQELNAFAYYQAERNKAGKVSSENK